MTIIAISYSYLYLVYVPVLLTPTNSFTTKAWKIQQINKIKKTLNWNDHALELCLADIANNNYQLSLCPCVTAEKKIYQEHQTQVWNIKYEVYLWQCIICDANDMTCQLTECTFLLRYSFLLMFCLLFSSSLHCLHSINIHAC